MKKKIEVTVSGSFHKHLNAIQRAVESFRDRGIEVLSPANPYITDRIGPFLFVASDKHRSVKLVQNRHLAAISQSDFLWLVSPDGYVGQSASLELGYAIAMGVPIYGEVLPPDLTLQEYIIKVESIDEAIKLTKSKNSKRQRHSMLLVDPSGVIDDAHQRLENIQDLLTSPSGKKDASKVEYHISEDMKELEKLFNANILELR